MFSIIPFSFSLSFEIQFLSIFSSLLFYVNSLSLLHVRAAMAAQSVILITLLTIIIIIIFFWNCLLIVID